MFFGRTKFKELRERSPRMPARMLSARLKLLLAHGLIERRTYSEHPLRAEYALTERGLSLAPLVEAVANWGLQHEFAKHERGPIMRHIREGIVRGPARKRDWSSAWVRQAYAAGSNASRRASPRRLAAGG